LLALLLTSCATTSTTTARFPLGGYTGPTVPWQGRTYVPLPILCDTLGLPWEWDRVTRVATVYRGATAYRFLLGSRIYTTNDSPQLLDAPVVLHRDAVLVPDQVAGWWAPAPVTAPSAPRAAKPRRMAQRSRPSAHGVQAFRRIVIDAGHGGHDPGAIGLSGTREKDVVLDIVRRLERRLGGNGLEIVMTRETDRFVPLADRIGLANRRQADLFISIHANANRSRKLSGLEVYYLPETPQELRRAAEQAERWPWRASQHSALTDDKPLRIILWDLINHESRRTAVQLGLHLSRTLAAQLNLRSRGVRGARFHVLRHAAMPAILVEVGYLSNPLEERRLATPAYRDALASALATGLLNFAQAQRRAER